MKHAAVLLLQVLALFLLNQAGYATAAALGLTVPGNLLGMLFLLVLLASGVVPLRWIEASTRMMRVVLKNTGVVSTEG